MLEAPAAFAPISTRALSTNIMSATRLKPLNKRDSEIRIDFDSFRFSVENYEHGFIHDCQEYNTHFMQAPDEDYGLFIWRRLLRFHCG